MNNRNIDIQISTFLLDRSERNFNMIYAKYNKPIYRIALSLVNYSPEQAEDVVQETWIAAIRNLHGFKGESSFKTWLTGILINKSREAFKNTNEIPIDKEALDKSILDGPVTKIDIEEALKRLTPGYREVLILHDIEGYKHHEVAAILGINEGTSKSQLFNARKKLRNYLK